MQILGQPGALYLPCGCMFTLQWATSICLERKTKYFCQYSSHEPNWENEYLVTEELVEFEKSLPEVQDFRNITHHFKRNL